ncbi:thiazolylpeptide-type bacteriocin [Streptomyces rimosus]|uniref:thiazolylpeptide-type bacteriocin n=1 Tax=Streptomyces TaxID=1883 RepID=UPI0006B26C50|nr:MULTISPECIES: thiazolylpeptide-type bacteriocin [Streptomyces]KAA6223201.1 thiazolylpeptide-type bacteriocin [Streptomyces albofaciens JCM 4342]KOT87454.1 lantibiotic protein [Streptomyces rimosus subsp. pseudoverticillatus]
MADKLPLADLARDMLTLESETFEINDYNDDSGAMMDGCTSTTSCSTTSSTTSCTSSCG